MARPPPSARCQARRARFSPADRTHHPFALVRARGRAQPAGVAWTLHGDRDSGSLIPEAMLAIAGAPVRLVDHAFDGSALQAPEYLAINPLGQVPALVTPEGDLLTESAAIILYLAERFPEAALAPPPKHPQRGRFLRWVVFIAANIYPCVARRDFPARISPDPACADSVKQAALDEARRHWALLLRELAPAPWCLDAFSALDIQVAVMSRWMGGAATRDALFPALAAHAGRVMAHPALVPVALRHYGPAPG